MKKNIVLVCCLLFHIYTLTAQTNVGVRFFAPTIHPFEEENNLLYSSKIDTAGKFLIEPGVVLTFENYADNNKVAIRMEQAFYKDGTKNWAGYTHIGLRLYPLRVGNHSFGIGLGPTFFYRKSWTGLNGYIADAETFKTKGDWQYKFVALSGGMEYSYAFNKRHDVSISFHHLQPKAFTFAVGYTYWIKVKTNGRRPCNCPGFH